MKRVLLYLKELLKKDDTVVIATSGGPDSMCLLHLLCEFKDYVNIVVAHVNHNLREEAILEANFVKEFCENNNLIYEYMEILEYNHNIESEAREKRYSFFKSLVSKYKANYLMTAHHGDDLIETILMRIVRGSNLRGYKGFSREQKYLDYTLVRPLISVSKQEILNFMDEHNYKYFIDKSNYSKDYTRNRYRMDVLPFLKKEDENVHHKFWKFSECLEEVNIFLDNYIKDLKYTIKSNEGLLVDKLKDLDEFILKRIMETELMDIYGDDIYLLTSKHIKLVIDLIKNKVSNGVVNLPNNILAVKDYNYFKFVHTKEEKAFYEVFKGKYKTPLGIIKQVEFSDSNSNYVIRLNSKDIKLPLIIRSRLNGDKMEIKNLGGSKKIKDIFIDEKISKAKRDKIPVVIDSDGVIIWLPGVKKSKFDVERNGICDIILSYEEE